MNRNLMYIVGGSIVIVVLVLIYLTLPSDDALKPTSSTADDAVNENGAMEIERDLEMQDVAEGTYVIDPNTSDVVWTGKAIGKEHYGTVRIAQDSAITYAQDTISSGEIIIDMTSIDVQDLTGDMEEKLAQHLKSDDFFSTETHPEAVLRFTNVSPTDQAQMFTVMADLTIRGITKPVVFDAYVTSENDDIIVTADVVIDRTEWDVTFGSERFATAVGATIIDDNISFDMMLRGSLQ